MRRAALVLGPFTLLAGAIFACESDPDGNGGPAFLLDGSTPAFDGGQQPFDSSAPDSTPDATPDAPPGPPSVTVTVTGRAGPRANVRVVFHDANGAVLETKLTDATGKARSSGAALPAMASALIAVGSARHIVTYTGLENGDDLAVREPESDQSLGQYAVTMPGPFDDAGESRYDIHAGDCYGFADGPAAATIDLYRSCVPGSQSAVLVRALDPNNATIGHSFKKANPVPTDGGTTAVATSPWTAPGSVTVNATNVPQNESVGVELLEIADGHGYADGFNHSLDDNGSATFKTATGFADALQSSIYLFPGSGSRQVITKRVAPASTITFDAAQVLPPLTAASLTGANARRPVISWTGSTAGTDGGIVQVRFYGPEDANYDWTFIVAPGSTTVTAPAMPAEAEAFLPVMNDAGAEEVFQFPEVAFVEADVIPSYTTFRRTLGTLAPAGSSFTFGFPTLPVNGTFRATGWVLLL